MLNVFASFLGILVLLVMVVASVVMFYGTCGALLAYLFESRKQREEDKKLMDLEWKRVVDTGRYFPPKVPDERRYAQKLFKLKAVDEAEYLLAIGRAVFLGWISFGTAFGTAPDPFDTVEGEITFYSDGVFATGGDIWSPYIAAAEFLKDTEEYS